MNESGSHGVGDDVAGDGDDILVIAQGMVVVRPRPDRAGPIQRAICRTRRA